MVFRFSGFCEIIVEKVLVFVMDNHFHLCVRVSKREGELPESEVLRRVGVLYGEDRRDALEKRLAGFREEGDDTTVAAELAKLRARMGDLSEFMKTFKQRISQWYNSNYSHEGTLWGGRFKSVLVEDGRYLHNLVAYIHGNPIRAGLVTRAADYEWSAPGAAAKGDAWAWKGLSLRRYSAAAVCVRICKMLYFILLLKKEDKWISKV